MAAKAQPEGKLITKTLYVDPEVWAAFEAWSDQTLKETGNRVSTAWFVRQAMFFYLSQQTYVNVQQEVAG